MRIDLADDEQLVPLPGGGHGHHLLRATVGIHLGGVDQRHAQVDAQAQRVRLGLRRRALVAHVPRALPQAGNLLATRQKNSTHQAAASSTTRITRRKLPPHSFSSAPRS